MKLLYRISSFVTVGFCATVIHTGILFLLLYFNVETALANAIAYVLAFLFSLAFQQKYTFADRLNGSSFKLSAALIILFANLLISVLLGNVAAGRIFSAFLPLTPAVVNFVLFYVLSGTRLFKI